MSAIPMKSLLLRFAIIYFVASIAIAVIGSILETYFGISTSGSMAFLAVMVGASDMGQNFYKQTARVPEKTECWRLARWAVLITFGVSTLFVAVMFMIYPNDLNAMFTILGVKGMLIIALIIGVISLLITRFFVGFGARSLAKAELKNKIQT